jgi:hypothetical protein
MHYGTKNNFDPKLSPAVTFIWPEVDIWIRLDEISKYSLELSAGSQVGIHI